MENGVRLFLAFTETCHFAILKPMTTSDLVKIENLLHKSRSMLFKIQKY